MRENFKMCIQKIFNEYQINKEFIVKNCDTSKKSDILQLLNSNKVLDWILIKNNKNDFEI